MVSNQKVEARMKEVERKMEERFAEVDKKFEAMMLLMKSEFDAMKTMGKKEDKESDSSEQEEIRRNEIHSSEVAVEQIQNPLKNYERKRTGFPIFDGSEFRSWRNKCELFFKQEGVPEERRTKLLLMSMEGKALSWQLQFLRTGGNVDTPWRKLMEDIACRFDEGIFDQPFAELVNLKQTDSLEEYMSSFDEFAYRTGLDDSQALGCFLAGLKRPLELAVRLQNPSSVTEAMKIAEQQNSLLIDLVESTYQNSKPNQPFNQKPTSSYSYSKPSPMKPSTNQNPITSQSSTNSTNPNHGPPFKPNSRNTSGDALAEERGGRGLCLFCGDPGSRKHKQFCKKALEEERGGRGLCLFCGEQGSRKHKQVCKKAFLSLLDEEEEQNEVVVSQELQTVEPTQPLNDTEEKAVPLNAKLGGGLMKIAGKIKDKEVIMVVVSGSAQNFMAEKLVKLLGLKTSHAGQLNFMAAGGHTVTVVDKCERVPWESQGVQFSTDFYVLPSSGCSVMLGVEWLQTLGVTDMNFRNMTMKFQFNGQKVCLQGITDKTSRKEEATVLNLRMC